MTSPQPEFPLYPRGSCAYRWQRLGALLAISLLIWTLCVAIQADRGQPSILLIILAVLWGVFPPAWWWAEFFFIYPPYHNEKKFELFKFAAQASLAIWAPIAVGLVAYISSDYFKPPPACPAQLIQPSPGNP
jgi:lysylphosphatidylglycerol synthetase-like protein (DUF2156 family)